MRNLINITQLNEADVSNLRKEIIAQVKQTQDTELLDKIYTVLNQSGLADRISSVLERDTDTKGFVDIITKIIIDTPGTFQEKNNFINGFPTGYVDVNKMLSGNRVKFSELLEGGDFVLKVFNSLKRETFGTAKGPGEFALAVMSPHIKITGKGDLNIGKSTIEVKASAGKEISSGGGRLGEPGLLQYADVPAIIERHLGIDLEKVAPTGVGLGSLTKLASKSTTVVRKSLGKELFGYIFKGTGADTSELVTALTNGTDLRDAFVKANYEAYHNKSEFDGIMVMNFALGELHYFRDVNDLVRHVYRSVGVYLVSNDMTKGARQILTQITLAPFKEPEVSLPAVPTGKQTPKATSAFEKSLHEFSADFAQKQSITDTHVISQIFQLAHTMLLSGKSAKQTMAKLKRDFPVGTQAKPTAASKAAAAKPTQSKPKAKPSAITGKRVEIRPKGAATKPRSKRSSTKSSLGRKRR